MLALSSGGVTVNKEVLVDIEPVEFDMARAAFVKKNPGLHVVFMTETELNVYLKMITGKRLKW